MSYCDCDTRDLPASWLPAIEQTLDALRERKPILYEGPPGIGKTMIARRITTLLPPLPEFESGILTERYRNHGLVAKQARVLQRPFRAPHHSVSAAALGGGGRPWRPGESGLAEFGVLFLDEIVEFSRQALGNVPTDVDFQLVASVNRCPCGWLGSAARSCMCSPGAVQRFRARVDDVLYQFGDWARITLEHHANVRDLAQGDRCPPSSQLALEVWR